MKPAPRDALLIEGLGAKPGPEMKPEMADAADDTTAPDEDTDSFASDAYEALEAKDPEAFKVALRGLVESCMANGY